MATCYVCETCGSMFPGNAPGTQSLIAGETGFTVHVCSGACHRAWVNRDRRASKRLRTRARFIRAFRDAPEMWVLIAAVVGALVIQATQR